MPFDGNGNYQLPPGVLGATGEVISSEDYNDLLADLATALSTTLLRSGVAAMTGPLLMGDQRIRSVADAVADSDAMPRSQITDLIETETVTKVPRTSATGSLLMPGGTTAERDAEEDREPLQFRYNTTLGGLEFWDDVAEVYRFVPIQRYRGADVELNGLGSAAVTDIPEWCSFLRVNIKDLSLNGTNNVKITLTGSVSGEIVTGYVGGGTLALASGNNNVDYTDGMAVYLANAARVVIGFLEVDHNIETGEVWIQLQAGLTTSGGQLLSQSYLQLAAGERITEITFKTSGVNTFDSGTLHPVYLQ